MDIVASCLWHKREISLFKQTANIQFYMTSIGLLLRAFIIYNVHYVRYCKTAGGWPLYPVREMWLRKNAHQTKAMYSFCVRLPYKKQGIEIFDSRKECHFPDQATIKIFAYIRIADSCTI
jgi:hypothetical protein